MNNVVEFKLKESKPVRSLYIVDKYYVVLAHSEDEALEEVRYQDETDESFEVVKLDDQKEIYVIKSGKVEVILWQREPVGLEQLSFKLKIRDFIDRDLKSFSVPSIQDVLEDAGAKNPKK